MLLFSTLFYDNIRVQVLKLAEWKTMFHSTWKTFESKLKPILQSLASRRQLLESEKASATLYGIQKLLEGISTVREEQRRRIAQENLEEHRARLLFIREKLQAPDYQIDQEISTEDRSGHPSGMWIFEDPKFQSWSNKDVPGHGLLYVNGIPGAGGCSVVHC